MDKIDPKNLEGLKILREWEEKNVPKTAIDKRGLVQGLFAGFIRILSCNPFSKKNYYDPVK